MSNAMWDERYTEAAAAGSTVWSRGPNAWIESTVGALPPGRAVDLAAGEGRNALWLASLGWPVTAVDFSAAGLAIGKARAAELRAGTDGVDTDIDWVVADATTWVAPEPVDLVVIAYLQLPAEQLARAVANAAASLRPGGTLAMIGHDRDNLSRGIGGPQNPLILHDVAELRAAAASTDLEVIECRQVERPVDGGVAIDAILLARRPTD
ncbi:class I SAM-dependent methyltransferase [Lacisediminihabitans profunda]|uniref:Class I SAM-dependent methyltransferase n=1 Tax=Lacisediminihabitans profunda TaxID=2594790 RepID=A0A5C8UNQ8_9MICO|nr:class I SAM-dependent methyltransferase [Lacisediminihabitans profunda]TXN30035.1 class I SAM-dependent methyltransferase [Lacisediminihabitans profunda]